MPATYCGKIDRNECVDTIFVEIFWNYPVDVGSPTGAEDHFEDHLTGVPKAAQLTDDSADSGEIWCMSFMYLPTVLRSRPITLPNADFHLVPNINLPRLLNSSGTIWGETLVFLSHRKSPLRSMEFR